ncbi:glutathione s-transferase theta-1-like [Stylonychia lemnae]|uniref:Glutathione s-transferase theta-1-like n=1 Tax=Stylonychia lemnae TaxID=5949 RepID=A0A078ADW4_STYLE|nr:glutathione s-transferase theta-1-like [Stylonychia lemnae]|eukprot:CDW80399.1 glutathione s-transferase theta-1-like [Stylonychia lemnae]
MEPAGEGITLYWSLVSQPSRSVKALLLAGDVPHKEEQKGEEYAKINPRQLVPFIKDGDFGLGESNAILKYIADSQASVPEHYWPKELKERYRVDQFLEYYQFHFRPALLSPLRTRIGQKFAKMDIPQDVLDFQEQNKKTALDTLERLLHQYEGDFLASNQISIGDFQIYFELTNLILLKETWETYPAITAWYNKVSENEHVKKINEQWSAATSALIPVLNN